MSYVGAPFDYDLFVSYSHGDALGEGNALLQKWSCQFAEALEDELRAFPQLGRDFRMFLDRHDKAGQGLDPFKGLTPQLAQDAGASAILTVLLGPHYLASKWCDFERDSWQKGQASHGIACDERIALAKVWPLENGSPLPALLTDGQGQGLPGFWFYDREKADIRPQPYGWISTADADFRRALLELVGHVRLKLEKVRELVRHREREKRDAERLGGAEQTIYLHAREADTRRWEETWADLSGSGFTVVPGEPDRIEKDPEDALKRRSERVQTMSECDALLILASKDGWALDADLLAVGRTDRNSAKARSRRMLPGAVLDPVGTVRTPQRGLFAKKVQVDWIEAPAKASAVQNWLVEKSQVGGGRG